MSDKKRTLILFLLLVCTFIMPLLAWIIGWRSNGWQTGMWAALAVFAFFVILSAVTITRIKMPEWITILMPLVLSLFYLIFPDLIPGIIDDAATMLFSSILSFSMWMKRRRALKYAKFEESETGNFPAGVNKKK